MGVWSWVIDSPGSGGRELTAARSRKLTFKRRGPSTASFTIDGTTEEAAEIEELISDVIAYRDGRRLFRGRVGPTGDDVDGEAHKTVVSAGDYRSVLERRMLIDTDTLNFIATDAALVAREIVADVQSHVGGDLQITNGTGYPTGSPVTVQFPAGIFATPAIDQLQNAGHFDWEIDADLRLNIFPGSRVFLTDTVLEYGAQVSKFSRRVDPGPYANAGRFSSGDGGVGSTYVTAPDLATRPEGRWDAQIGLPDVLSGSVLLSTAAAELDRRQTTLPGYSVTLRDGFWLGRDHVWVGHVVDWRARTGRVNRSGPLIVEELTVAIDDNGNESVTLALGWGFPSALERVGTAEHRLRDLERL